MTHYSNFQLSKSFVRAVALNGLKSKNQHQQIELTVVYCHPAKTLTGLFLFYVDKIQN